MTAAPAVGTRISKKGLLVPWLIVGALGLGYWLVWLSFAETAKKTLAHAVEKAGPAKAEIAEIGATGFPFRLSLTLIDVKLSQGPSGWAGSASRVRLTAMPWDLTHWIADRTSNVSLTTPAGRVWTLEAPQLEGSAHWGSMGASRISLMTGRFRAVRDDGAVVKVSKGELHVQADPKRPVDLAFVIDAEGIELPGTPNSVAVLGANVEKLRLAGMIPDGQGLHVNPITWLGTKGRIEPKDGTLYWGPLRVSDINGSFGTNAEGRVQGELRGTGGLVAGGTKSVGPVAISIVDGVVRTGPFEVVTIPPLLPAKPVNQK